MKVAAAVLCGGRGERLRPLTDFFQKTMIPIGPRRQPLLEHIIVLLVRHGVTEITLLTGYRADEIERYFEDGKRFGARLRYSQDPRGANGSANAVANALKSGKIGHADVLVVYYGDILSDLNVRELVQRHASANADATLVLSGQYALPVGVAVVKNGMVSSFKEKPTLEMNVTTGIMTVGRRGMQILKDGRFPRKNDLMADFVPKLLRAQGRVAAFYTSGPWYDLGTLASYERLNDSLRLENAKPLK